MTRLLAALALATTALAQEMAPSNQPAQKATPVEVWSARPGVGSAKRTRTLTARVMAVDVDNRVLTIQGAQGDVQTMKVGPAVRRLKEVTPGDTITVKFEQKLTLEHQPEGAASIDKAVTETAKQGGTESPPSGTQGTQVRGTVKVARIDVLNRVVTLQDEKGDRYQVKAGPDIDFAKVKVGQQYLATYTETLAVKVEKPTGAAMFAPAPAR